MVDLLDCVDTKPKKKHVNIPFTDKEYETLKSIALKYNTTPRGLCCKALAEWLLRNESGRENV